MSQFPDVSKLSTEQYQFLIDVLRMMKVKPDSVPLFVVYHRRGHREIEALPLGDVDFKTITNVCQIILDASTKRFDKTIFTEEPPQN